VVYHGASSVRCHVRLLPNTFAFVVDGVYGDGSHRILMSNAATGALSATLTVNRDGQLESILTETLCAFDPADNPYRYPMAVGDEWAVDHTFACGPTQPSVYTRTSKVISRSTVNTAIGERP
jgi:hypothetical protein